MICNKCGSQLSDTAIFCTKCGNNVRANYPPVHQYEPPQKKQNNNTLVILTIILIIVMILTISVIAWLVFRKTPDKISPSRLEPPISSPISTPSTPTSQVTSTPVPTTPSPTASSDYFLPTASEYITASDLRGFSKEQVALVRNEIYARHGYIFQTEPYKSYFEAKSWYVPNPYFKESDFNRYEKANKDFIVEYEEKMGWR